MTTQSNAILDSLFPNYSNRKFVVSIIKKALTGKSSLLNRLCLDNFRTALSLRNVSFKCNVCGNYSKASFDYPDLKLRREHHIGLYRETLQCRHCDATMRDRSLAAGMIQEMSRRLGGQFTSIKEIANHGLKDIRILDTDRFSPMSKILFGSPNYITCSYIPNRAFGELISDNYYNIDLQSISFDSGSFDIVMTSDVMEHVRNVDCAHSEIYRILKREGTYLFNVPYESTSDKHIILVDTSGSEDVFIVAPQYHGDPLSNGILAYRVFGRELFEDLSKIGFELEFQCIDAPDNLIISGDLFVARKSD